MTGQGRCPVSEGVSGIRTYRQEMSQRTMVLATGLVREASRIDGHLGGRSLS